MQLIRKIIQQLYFPPGICDDSEARRKIDLLHKRNKFKLMPMPCFEYNGRKEF